MLLIKLISIIESVSRIQERESQNLSRHSAEADRPRVKPLFAKGE
jgi:hypothetical protein